MPKTAIDVVLLPSANMADTAIEINAELLQKFDGKVVLDKKHCLPHISLCMGVVDDKDIPELDRILSGIASKLPALKLVAEGIRATVIPTGEKVSELMITNTAALQALHESVMQKLQRYLSYEVDASMLYNPVEIEAVTFTWIKGYAQKYVDPSLFHPHITVGFGETDTFTSPLEFTDSALAVCQLGNYCTCRKVLARFALD